MSVDVGGNEVVDLQEDMIDPETLETAAYKFAELYRDGGEMHERTGTAVMVESVVLTEKSRQQWNWPPVPCRLVGGSASASLMMTCGRK